MGVQVINEKLTNMEQKTSKTLSKLNNLRKSLLKSLKKKDKIKDKELIDKNESKPTKNDDAERIIASIIEPFRKLEIQIEDAQPKDHTNKGDTIATEEDDDESNNFEIKIIEDDRTRIYSQSSEDSGFTDANHDVIETLEKLTLNDKENAETETEDTESDKKKKKKTKMCKRVVKRAPIRGKVSEYSAHPYSKELNAFKPINQINQNTLTGGHVIINPTPDPEPTAFPEDAALESIAHLYQENPEFWAGVLDNILPKDNLLSEFPITEEFHAIDIVPEQQPLPNPIEEFTQHLSYEDSVDLSTILAFPKNDSIFPTPPHSLPSPLSESHAFYASTSDYTLSPDISSPQYHSDFEKYQEIPQISPRSCHDDDLKRDSTSQSSTMKSFEDLQKDIPQISPQSCYDDELKGDRSSSVSQSSMTMKNFKDLQKEIKSGFSSRACCDATRKTCRELFELRLKKLEDVVRMNLCLKVSKLDLKMSYGILHHILLSLSKECENEDIQYSLFALVCERVLAQSPSLFFGDFGLSILKAASLRCPHHPLLTRYIVKCVYLALSNETNLSASECVFHEVDAQGDNLVIACARGGDAFALVLAEITRCNGNVTGKLPPLFKLHHANADGYTALHVACRKHSATASYLHTVHVLLRHASADMWKGDIKGGDTAVHLAVNSATCDLRLVMMLFETEDRKQWKKLAHKQNTSSVTPLDYARSATKSSSRPNYPHEVLDFLKKCR